MEQQIKLPISYKIIEKNNIIDLAKYVKSLEQDKKYETIKFYIDFIDNSTRSSEDIEIFESRFFEEKEIKRIRMSYRNYSNKRNLSIYIYNYDMNENSSIEIESEEEQWLFTVKGKIEELLSLCNKQSRISYYMKNYYWIAIIISSILAFISTFSIIEFIRKLFNFGIHISIPLITPIIIIMEVIYNKLANNLEKAYPSIEIAIKDKNNMSKKRRNNIISMITLIIIPLLLTVAYDIVIKIMT